jgi:hypothetical protein
MLSNRSNRGDTASLRTRAKSVIGLFTIVLLASCATTSTVKQIDRLESVSENPKILIMTPDVKYYLLTASGIPQPHAEWTEAARINFADALQSYAEIRDIQVITVDQADQLTEVEISYQKLYSAVGISILIHHFGVSKLPTKQGSFDWSLGPGVDAIGKKYGADYALFSYYRDYQASGGRVAFAVLAAVAGVGVSTGSERGFASLVDLHTGNIVWFNQITTGVGELRYKEGARATIDALFKDLPGG